MILGLSEENDIPSNKLGFSNLIQKLEELYSSEPDS